MLKKSAGLSCSFGLSGLSGVFSYPVLATRQTPWREVRGVDSIAARIFEMRDANRLNRTASVVRDSFGLAMCKVKN